MFIFNVVYDIIFILFIIFAVYTYLDGCPKNSSVREYRLVYITSVLLLLS